MPSSTKLRYKRGKNFLFPSSPPTVEIKGKIPFTRSSILKEVFKDQSLPETPMHKEKEKSIENPVEEKSETPIQRKKGKGTKGPLERKYEVFVKDFEELVKNKGEVDEQEKKHKGKGFVKVDETHKQIPVQMEEDDEKKPAETMHVSTPPGGHTFKRLIRQLKESRK